MLGGGRVVAPLELTLQRERTVCWREACAHGKKIGTRATLYCGYSNESRQRAVTSFNAKNSKV